MSGQKHASKAGLTAQQVEALFDWEKAGCFDERMRAVLAYTDAMTRDIAVADEIYAELRKHFSERQTVELSMLIGAYNMLTRFLKALKVDPEP